MKKIKLNDNVYMIDEALSGLGETLFYDLDLYFCQTCGQLVSIDLESSLTEAECPSCGDYGLFEIPEEDNYHFMWNDYTHKPTKLQVLKFNIKRMFKRIFK